jgi:hypothetical protein
VWWRGVFAGSFAKFGVQNVVNWPVKRGGVVVKVWLKTTANQHRKNMPDFCTFFAFLFDSDWQAVNSHRRGQFAPGATCAAPIVTSPGDFSDAYFHAGFPLNAG